VMRDPRTSTSSRRTFLGASAGLLGAAALSACSAPAQPAAPAAQAPAKPAESKPADAKPADAAKPAAPAAATGGGKQVKAMVQATWAELGMRDATAAFNTQMSGKVQVELEDVADGFEPKVLAMIKDKSVPWSAHGYAPFFNQYNYIKSGLATPIDDQVKASSVAWAKDMKSTYYAPNIDDVNRFEGKLYFVPMKLNIHLLGYRSDYLKKAGVDKMPDTWDDFEKVLGEVKKATAADGVIPFAIRKEFYRTVGTSFVTRKQQIWDDKGVFTLDVPEFYDTINMYNRWFKNGLVTSDSFIAAADIALWEKGKIFAGIDSHSWIRTAKKVWGNDNVAGALPPQATKTDKPRTWMHVDSGFLISGGPEPQAGADWLLSVFAPDGEPADKWWPKVITFSGSPVHKTMFDKYVTKNTDYPEIAESYKAIANSTIMPVVVGASYPPVQAKIWPWLERFWAGEISDKEAVTGATKEVQEEIQKTLKP
jgi:ABC-type glycerol-3-phosphate transport system substrate-binding protein